MTRTLENEPSEPKMPLRFKLALAGGIAVYFLFIIFSGMGPR